MSIESSLIIFIKKNDDLFESWMLFKSTRHNVDDIQNLKRILNVKYDIKFTSFKSRRFFWIFSILFVRTKSQYFHWEIIMLSNRVTRNINKNNEKFWIIIQKKWRANVVLCRRQSKDFRIKLKTRYETLLNFMFEKHKIDLNLMIFEINLFAIFMNVVRDTMSIFLIITYFVWYFLFWFVCTLLIVLLCLQFLIMTYIVINIAFFFDFCQQNLSMIRNWICNFWNEIQRNIFSFVSINLNNFFENILHSEKKIMTYELSHHFALYQTKIRFFRVFLFEFEYFFDDQTYFDDKFNDFINQISQAILTTQRFHFHIVKIINIHFFDIKFVIRKLDDDDFIS